MNKFFFLIFFSLSVFADAAVYYVANNGSDTNSGTIDAPLYSIHKAQQSVSPGDTVYIRGGDYVMQESDVAYVKDGLFACISYLDKSGQANKRINYWAYPGEQPVFDFSAVKPAGKRVVGIYMKGNYLHIKGIEMTGIQVTILTHTESYCIYSVGSYNIIENVNMHDNLGTGLRHNKGGHNLFLNCDAYRNHDNVSEDKRGGNTDGFGCHPSSTGVGNVFRGCRAWFNSDDGFDCIRADASIVFDNCWAFNNGYSPSFASLGDGNGFKIGGFAYDVASKIPNPVPSHTVKFSLAVNNKANGFYSNHHLAGNTWDNNSAYSNKVNYNMVNRESPESDNINVDGYDHILRNNVSYKARSKDTDYIDTEACTLKNNSFNMNVSITDDDFLSFSKSWLVLERKEDGSLPDVNFMKLSPMSSVINLGVDIGYPYNGDAPDLGCFETETESLLRSDVKDVDLPYILYPNPVRDQLFIKPSVLSTSNYQIKIFSLQGRLVYAGNFENMLQAIDMRSLNSATYLTSIQVDKSLFVQTVIKQ